MTRVARSRKSRAKRDLPERRREAELYRQIHPPRGFEREEPKAARAAPTDPATKCYAALAARVGPAPTNALELPAFMSRILIQTSFLTMEGKGDFALNQQMRAMSTAINRLMPLIRLHQAELVVKEARLRKARLQGTARRPGVPTVEALPANQPAGKIVRG